MDHDYEKAERHGHERGAFCELEIRGLLCHSCNRYVGWLDYISDTPTVAERAIAYLERHGSRRTIRP